MPICSRKLSLFIKIVANLRIYQWIPFKQIIWAEFSTLNSNKCGLHFRGNFIFFFFNLSFKVCLILHHELLQELSLHCTMELFVPKAIKATKKLGFPSNSEHLLVQGRKEGRKMPFQHSLGVFVHTIFPVDNCCLF